MTLEILFPESFIQALLAILAAIALDLILGVAVAIKYRVFDLKKLANFYTTSVIPNLLGWGGADIVLRMAAARVDAQWLTTLTQLGIGTLYAVAIVSLIGSLTDKLSKLKEPVPVTAPAVTVTMTLPTPTAPTPTVTTSAAGANVTDDKGRTLPVTSAPLKQ